MPLLDPNRAYTFSEISKLKAPTDEVLAEYGYSLERTLIDLPQYQGELDRLQERRKRMEEVLPYLDLTNEQSRREMLIAPLMEDLIHYTKAQLRIEYALKVNERLQGELDYLLRTKTNLLGGAGGWIWLAAGGKEASVDAQINSCAIGFCVGKLVYNPRAFWCGMARYLP